MRHTRKQIEMAIDGLMEFATNQVAINNQIIQVLKELKEKDTPS